MDEDLARALQVHLHDFILENNLNYKSIRVEFDSKRVEVFIEFRDKVADKDRKLIKMTSNSKCSNDHLKRRTGTHSTAVARCNCAIGHDHEWDSNDFRNLALFIQAKAQAGEIANEVTLDLIVSKLESIRTNTIKAAIEALPKKKPSVVKRKGYYPPYQPQVEKHSRQGYNEYADQAASNLKALIGGDES